MNDQELREMFRDIDRAQRSNLTAQLKLLIMLVEPCDIRDVRIDERDDPNNDHHTCRLVIEHYDATTSMINIEMNSLEAIFYEFCRFVAGGKKCYGLYLDHDERVE